MCNNPVDALAEDLITFFPMMLKKVIRLDTVYIKNLPNTEPIKILPLNQLMVLGILHEEGDLPISKLCKKLTISSPQMTIIIDKLVDLNLVYRVHNEQDRRTININITGKGKEYSLEILEIVKENLKNKLINLSSEDLLILLNSIEVTKRIFKKME
ncbi:MarR family transcriptional regulator [Clostridium sp. AWRP]|uniref:MarR family winged helix-turn-helix transcriptional regulator n=1 Tax=Clostridium sp. AWRP TaxID=2212991 RepID=UPI000FD8904B|nr:MarR family transcriptional regulator [Clostridium sp. AWRP]AZV56921.1 MarR family transcriptional regulator [Clostridium sp. AWRP]